jgi:hypothetical protein
MEENAVNSKEHCYPKDMSTPNISTTCLVIMAESSTNLLLEIGLYLENA